MKKESESNSQEKEKFFKTVNNFISNSGVVANGIKAVSNNIAKQADRVRRETERKAITTVLLLIGGILLIYGAIQYFMSLFDLSQYTNIIIGGLFVATAVVYKAFGK